MVKAAVLWGVSMLPASSADQNSRVWEPDGRQADRGAGDLGAAVELVVGRRDAGAASVVGRGQLDRGARHVGRLGVGGRRRGGGVDRDRGGDGEGRGLEQLDVTRHVDRPELERVRSDCRHVDGSTGELGSAVEPIVRRGHAGTGVGGGQLDRGAADVGRLGVGRGDGGGGVDRDRGGDREGRGLVRGLDVSGHVGRPELNGVGAEDLVAIEVPVTWAPPSSL